MPEETRKGVENIKKGEIDKRKKVWEEKEGPPTKKQKKMTAAQEERGKWKAYSSTHTYLLTWSKPITAEKREREARDKVEKQRLAKEEAERIAAEKKKKKPIRYPTEDLDVRIADKDKKAGMRVTRPPANRACIPFNDTSGIFETFLMTWNFLVVYGYMIFFLMFPIVSNCLSIANPFTCQHFPLMSLNMPSVIQLPTNHVHFSQRYILL